MSRILVTLCIILISVSLFAQDEKITEAEYKVSGICGMCKTRIEKAVKIKEVKYAKWDKKNKTLKLAYDSNAVSSDSLLKRVAYAGHDNEKFTAPDSAYAKLHSCCLYREQSSH